MNWVSLQSKPQYVRVSADGYYAIAKEFRGEFMAHHIAAVWAKPVEIGRANTLAGAQTICEQHVAKPAT